jgi:hypothetical protein
MSESETNELKTQLILLVISLGFHVFQAFVTGMKLRVKCKNCMCSLKPKGSSPSPNSLSSSSTERSPDEKQLTEVVVEK